jgi:hypothetical protein
MSPRRFSSPFRHFTPPRSSSARASCVPISWSGPPPALPVSPIPSAAERSVAITFPSSPARAGFCRSLTSVYLCSSVVNRSFDFLPRPQKSTALTLAICISLCHVECGGLLGGQCNETCGWLILFRGHLATPPGEEKANRNSAQFRIRPNKLDSKAFNIF